MQRAGSELALIYCKKHKICFSINLSAYYAIQYVLVQSALIILEVQEKQEKDLWFMQINKDM
jgi:hypothetical protein